MRSVVLPRSMGLGIVSGASRVQVGGSTGAVVVIAGIIDQQDYAGLGKWMTCVPTLVMTAFIASCMDHARSLNANRPGHPKTSGQE